MGYEITLPKDVVQLEAVVKRIISEGKQQRNPQAIRWWLVYWYLKGVRDFRNINYQEGTIGVNFSNTAGVLQFQYEDIVAKYQAQLGRFSNIDLSPKVQRLGIGLSGLRKASVAQVVLNAAFPPEKVYKLATEIYAPMLMYGTIGLNLWFEDEYSMGIEVVPPWELLPIPVDPASPSAARGLIRRRFVPKKWIQSLSTTPGAKDKVYNEMVSINVGTGNIPQEVKTQFQGNAAVSAAIDVDGVSSSSGFFSRLGSSMKKKDQTRSDIVEFAEVYMETADGYLAEYLQFGGEKKLHRKSYVGEKRHMPLRVARDIETGGFWGRSYVDTLIPMNTEMEYTIAQMFQMIQDWDLFGILYEPTTSGVPKNITRGKDGLKRARYEPDYASQGDKPFQVRPFGPGPMVAQVLKIGAGLADKVANQPTELMGGGAPGRVDSSAALGFLFEVSNTTLSPTARSLASALSGVYRAMLGIVRDKWDTNRIIEVSHLDDALAGVLLDPNTGELKLAENAIPLPDEVRVLIGSILPESMLQKKQELKEALSLQIITPVEYRIKVRKEGLDLPVGNEVEWQNYRRAMLENLILFGDGKKSGPIVVSDNDLHTIHLMVLNAFMARPEFFLADEAVRTNFEKHKQAHEDGLGAFPEDLPYPEDAAEQSLQAPAGASPGQGDVAGGGSPMASPTG